MSKAFVRIRREALMDRCTEPGAVNLVTGNRKAGKTFTMVSMMQPLVEGRIKGIPRTFLLTNVVYVEAGVPGRSMPPGVRYVDSVEALFREMLTIFLEYGHNVRLVLAMDEAQAHMLADQNSDPVNQAMLHILPVIRKFNLSVWFASPSMMNLVPKIRNFIDDPKNPGNLNYLWFKDLPRIRRFIRTKGLREQDYQFTTWKPSAQHDSVLLYVPWTSWTTKIADLREGYAYDDEAAATFRYADTPGFDHQAVIDMCSGIRKDELTRALQDYFDGLDQTKNEVLDPEEQKLADQAARVRRAGSLDPPLKWDLIVAVEGVPKSTLISRMGRYAPSAGAPSKKEEASANGDGSPGGGTYTHRDRDVVSTEDA